MTEPSTGCQYLRRRDYRPAIHHPDYFVTAHLRQFMEAAIAQHVGPGMRVADIGCGEQPWRQAIEAIGARYVGLDWQQNRAGTVDVLASAAAIPIAPAQVDVVICTEVLEHVLHTQDAVSEASRILRPGGRLLVTTPFAYPLHEAPHDYVRLTPYYVEELARRLGLRILLLERTGNALEVIATAACQMWRETPRASRGSRRAPVQRVARAAMAAAVNGVVRVASPILGRWLSKQHYLNLVAVLVKDDAPGARTP